MLLCLIVRCIRECTPSLLLALMIAIGSSVVECHQSYAIVVVALLHTRLIETRHLGMPAYISFYSRILYPCHILPPPVIPSFQKPIVMPRNTLSTAFFSNLVVFPSISILFFSSASVRGYVSHLVVLLFTIFLSPSLSYPSPCSPPREGIIGNRCTSSQCVLPPRSVYVI